MFWENANHIVPFVWLGNAEAANDAAFLRDNRVRLVVNCTKDIAVPGWYAELGIRAVRLPINDHDSTGDNATLARDIESVLDAVHEARGRGECVLVHCYAGMQRSATVVACYLMRHFNYRPEHAVFYVRHKRPIAFTPRPTFGRFLGQYRKH
jgi:predicted protein tyrosine phosphatase